MKRADLSWIFQSILVLALILGVAAFSYYKHSKEAVVQLHKELEFPFEVVRDRIGQEHNIRDITIILPRPYYSQNNLERLFHWYSRKYRDYQGLLGVLVYLDKDRVPFLRGNENNPPPLISSTDSSIQAQDLYDACFIRAANNGVDFEAKEMYSYIPDLARPSNKKIITLKGSFLSNASEEIERSEVKNGDLAVRITSYKIEHLSPSGIYYTFRSFKGAGNTDDNEEYKTIMTLRQDKLVTIPVHQIRFINDHIGYVFMGWKYAITIDGGESWSVWDAEADLQGWQCCNYSLIRDIQIASDGSGTMSLNSSPQEQDNMSVLHTKDYGRHWNRE